MDAVEETERAIQKILEKVEGDELLESVRSLRKASSDWDCQVEVTQKLMEKGAIAHIIPLLKQKELQFDVTWILCNVTSGTVQEARAAVDGGAIPLLIEIVSNEESSLNILDQSIWTLGNISGNTPEDRDEILRADRDIVAKLEYLAFNKLLKPDDDMASYNSLRMNICWMLCNLTGTPTNAPLVGEPQLTNIVRLLRRFLEEDDEEIIKNASHGLAYPARDPLYIGRLLDLAPRLNHILRFGNQERPLSVTIVLVGTLAAGTQDQIQTLLDSGLFKTLSNLTAHSPPPLQPYVIQGLNLTLTNVLEQATFEQLEKILLPVGLLSYLLFSLELPVGFDLQNPDYNVCFNVKGCLEVLQQIFEKARILPFPHAFAMEVSRSQIPIFDFLEKLCVIPAQEIDSKSVVVRELMKEAIEEISTVKPAKDR